MDDHSKSQVRRLIEQSPEYSKGYQSGYSAGVEAGLRRASEIASSTGQIGTASAEGTAPIDMMAKRIVVAILAQIGKGE